VFIIAIGARILALRRQEVDDRDKAVSIDGAAAA
jgi:hypothetical protein